MKSNIRSISFPRREDVERSNARRMNGLSTEVHMYKASDGGAITDQAQRDKMLSNFMAPGFLQLKVDSQVCLHLLMRGRS